MKNLTTTNILLLLIAIALIVLAMEPLRQPHLAQAETTAPYPLYIEPGTQMLRIPNGDGQVFGKVVVDLQTGKIWGFPTLTSAVYPVDISTTKPPVSHPFLLGTFAFADIEK
jgi:hypothetical protein